jgi:cell division protein FtsQ
VDRAEAARAAGHRLRTAGRGALLLAGAAAAALGAREGWRLATSGEALRLREVRFTGLQAASAEELLELSPVRPGDNLLRADLGALEQAALRHPWVLQAEARRRWPPAVEVAIREREAAALVDLGGLYLVDRGGLPFKAAVPGDGLDLPLVTGLSRDDFVQRRADAEALLASALRLADDWAAAGLARSHPLSEIHVGDEGVVAWAGEEGIEVRLGGGDLVPKLERLSRVLAALRAEGKRAEVILLDDRRHPSWVTVRPAGAPGSRRAGRTGPRGS